MVLEFTVYELKETSTFYNTIFKGGNRPNEFIVVGEETNGFLKLQQVEDYGICFLGDLPIDEFALILPKEDLQIKNKGFGTEVIEFDIPKKYLSLDIIETIQRLHSASD